MGMGRFVLRKMQSAKSAWQADIVTSIRNRTPKGKRGYRYATKKTLNSCFCDGADGIWLYDGGRCGCAGRNYGKKTSATNGYEIQYSTSKKFKSAKKKLTKKAKITIKNLKKKTYYIRIRSFKYDGNKKIYSKWSTVKKIRIKK